MVPIPGMADYTIVRTVAVDAQNMPTESGVINGGLTKRTTTSEGPVVVIDVPSLDGYLQKITKSGGKVVQPKQDVMGMGLYARVTDPEGNVIGIWETIKK
jgi:predicted enzyme related to lactoylglutathione lyase